MTVLQQIEEKISELNTEELFILLDKVTSELKNQTKIKTNNRDKILTFISKMEKKNYFPTIENPVQWQKKLRAEWAD